jgi:hypothetical protein
MGDLMGNDKRRTLDELASEPIDARDDAALRRMADAYTAADPVPEGLVDRINFGITLEALHAEIAELQRTGDLVGVRSETGSDVQTVTFTSASLTTMITITATSGDRVRIDGWITPGSGVRVKLRGVATTLEAIADEDGRFVFDDVPRGLAQFVLRSSDDDDARPVITPSIEI